jgi:superfamily II DNA or RNA helicase
MKKTIPRKKLILKADENEEKYKDQEQDKEKRENNDIKIEKEEQERNFLQTHPDENSFLYPTLNDPNFNSKIAEKKEFSDTQYDGTIYDIKSQSDILSNAPFELSPHQTFVKNFLSFQTPYNSLLLYHGLGTGKTCSAIGVAEEQRDYLKQLGLMKRIIIVATPNVQDNFRKQLFDESKMTQIDGNWTISGCVGNKLLKEINPMNMKGLSKEQIISQINKLIKTYYIFVGYIQFANYIEKERSNLKREFNNRLIIIDEVHNIRSTADNDNKMVAEKLMLLVKTADNLRLLLLSATPMYNSYKEIIWLLNLMNINDRRSTISTKDIFDSNGDFQVNEKGENIGKEMLIQKSTGYISYIRGENPYTFPFRIYPSLFTPQNTYQTIPYPKYQINGKEIRGLDEIKLLNLFLIPIGSYQSIGYNYIINNLKNKNIRVKTKMGEFRNMPTFENMDSFGYTLLQLPIESLNIVYPMSGLEDAFLTNQKIDALKVKEAEIKSSGELVDLSDSDNELVEDEDDEEDIEKDKEKDKEKETIKVKADKKTKKQKEKDKEEQKEEQIKGIIRVNELIGHNGLSRIMKVEEDIKKQKQYEYRSNEPNIFAYDEIGKYSCKIKHILDIIQSGAEGIILIYSQYLDGGLVPMALALEEIGFSRFGKDAKSLFKTPSKIKKIGKYSMITGDPRLSPDNNYEINSLTSQNNINGDKIKVVLISAAGSEGIDLKFVRQIHILEPWYNMNRIEQIIGRGVRNFSHKDLPFEKRNVQIFMYGTLLEHLEQESADVYVYRVSEKKAFQLGKVSRVLKESAVDCIINHGQTNFTQDNMTSNKKIKQILSDQTKIDDFKAGDEPYSATCDYMDCEYECNTSKKIMNINEDTYNEAYVMVNAEKLITKIKQIMKEKYFYKKQQLIHMINTPKPYPLSQIFAALTYIIEEKEYLTDKYGKNGYLVNIGDYYLYQPLELNNKNIDTFERYAPIDFKHNAIRVNMDNIAKIKPKSMIQLDKEDGGKSLILNMKHKYDISINIFNESRKKPGYKIPKTNEEYIWYEYCGLTMKMLIEDISIDPQLINIILIEHIIDTLDFNNKLLLFQYIYSLEISKRSFEELIKHYLDSKIISSTSLKCIILFENNERMYYILKERKWIKATPVEETKIVVPEIPSLNNIIGFYDYDKKYFFKIKENNLKRNTGATCDQMAKTKKIEIINKILGFDKYISGENTSGLAKELLCSYIEFMLRYNTKIYKDSKIWFLTYESYLLNN